MQQRFLQLISAAQARGVKVVLSSHALQLSPGARGNRALTQIGEICVLMQMHPDNVIRAYSDFNKMMAAMAERLRLPFADVRAAVPADAQYWGDALHFKEPGARLAADAVAQTILEASWL